jgi:hypothetical protein
MHTKTKGNRASPHQCGVLKARSSLPLLNRQAMSRRASIRARRPLRELLRITAWPKCLQGRCKHPRSVWSSSAHCRGRCPARYARKCQEVRSVGAVNGLPRIKSRRADQHGDVIGGYSIRPAPNSSACVLFGGSGVCVSGGLGQRRMPPRLVSASDHKSSLPARGAATVWRLDRFRIQAAASDQPRDHRVGVPPLGGS